MEFVKVHSLGNDFLIVELEESGEVPDISGFARRICDRHTGVGADGLIIISVKDKGKAVAGFRIFNADGSEPEISGNGLRCAAAYLFAGQKIAVPKIVFQTNAGNREAELLEIQGHQSRIRIEMGTPRLTSKDIPFDDGAYHEKIIDYPLSINRKIYLITVVSLGNPHCAMFYDRFPARIEWHQIGREIEIHPFFPNRTNVEFVRVLSRQEIEVLFWERGVGETLSSGTGSSAAAVASILRNQADRKVAVRTSLGSVIVEWERDRVFQSAPAEIVFEGTLL
jgi:diaminopimelate epimerase